jgi:hypothetical protein
MWLALSCGGERPPGPDVIAGLGRVEIVYGDFEGYLRRSGVGPDLALESTALSALLDQFLAEEAIRQLALERGLAGVDEPASAALRALLRADGVGAVSEAEVRRFYERDPQRFVLPERVRLCQILTDTRERAEESAAAIRAGEPFASVAQRLSQEPAARQGGAQGILARDDLPPAFVATVFALAPGEVSEVVRADYGFHLFQVVERYPEEIRPFEEVEVEIRERLAARRLADARERLVVEALARYNPRVYEGNLPFHYAPSRLDRPTGGAEGRGRVEDGG